MLYPPGKFSLCVLPGLSDLSALVGLLIEDSKVSLYRLARLVGLIALGSLPILDIIGILSAPKNLITPASLVDIRAGRGRRVGVGAVLISPPALQRRG